MHYLILIAYWFIFWFGKLRNPYQLCTSELMTTNFPFWRSGAPFKDSIYYKYPICIPFLSTLYPPSYIASKLAKFFTLDRAFTYYVYFILAHYLVASMIAFQLFLPYGEIEAVFGAITLTYAGFNIKPQTPSFVYTMCWIPGMLIGGWFGIFSCFMAITGGYWPILVYVLPVAVFMNQTCLWGLLPALIQIIPFAWYWPKSIRFKQNIDKNQGKLYIWKLKDLFIPSNSVSLTNGVHYPEVSMYLGLAGFLIFHSSIWLLPLVLGILVAVGLIPPVQRIPARSLYLVTLSAVFLALESHPGIPLTIFQAFLLMRNSSLYPSFPFSQWWQKPSQCYPDSDYTGYLTNSKKHDYEGAFALR